jgi:hypothetical protein
MVDKTNSINEVRDNKVRAYYEDLFAEYRVCEREARNLKEQMSNGNSRFYARGREVSEEEVVIAFAKFQHFPVRYVADFSQFPLKEAAADLIEGVEEFLKGISWAALPVRKSLPMVHVAA